MAPHSSTLAWKIPWMEEPGRLQSMGSIRATERLHFHFSLSGIGEGNGNPLQCSCLDNPRDREAWWTAVYGITQSWTQLKQLSSNSSSISAVRVLVNKAGPQYGHLQGLAGTAACVLRERGWAPACLTERAGHDYWGFLSEAGWEAPLRLL